MESKALDFALKTGEITRNPVDEMLAGNREKKQKKVWEDGD